MRIDDGDDDLGDEEEDDGHDAMAGAARGTFWGWAVTARNIRGIAVGLRYQEKRLADRAGVVLFVLNLGGRRKGQDSEETLGDPGQVKPGPEPNKNWNLACEGFVETDIFIAGFVCKLFSQESTTRYSISVEEMFNSDKFTVAALRQWFELVAVIVIVMYSQYISTVQYSNKNVVAAAVAIEVALAIAIAVAVSVVVVE